MLISVESSKLQNYGILLILLVVFAPYFITIESLLGGSRLRVLAPLWGLLLSGSTAQFEIPLVFTWDFLVFWVIGYLYVYIILASMKTTNTLHLRSYLVWIGFVFLLQMCAYIIVFVSYRVSPPISIIPLPIPAIVAFLLAPLITKKRTDLWDTSSTSSE